MSDDTSTTQTPTDEATYAPEDGPADAPVQETEPDWAAGAVESDPAGPDAPQPEAATSDGKRRWRGRSNASKRTKADAAAATAAQETAEPEPEPVAQEKPVKQKRQKKEKPVVEKSQTEETQQPRQRKPFFGTEISLNQVRNFVGRAIWLVCVVFALALALTALFVALDANAQNEAVRKIVEFADNVNLGVFSLTNPIKDFDRSSPPSQDVRTALFNYGIAAIVWLLIGRVADRIIRP